VRTDLLGVHAGSLTYGAFLAIPPGLLIALSVASIVLANDPQAQRELLDAIGTLVPGLDQVASGLFTPRTASQLGLGLFGVLAVLWAASGFAGRSRLALGVVFRTGYTGLVEGRISGALIGIPAFAGFIVLAAVAGWAFDRTLGFWLQLVDYASVLLVGGVLFLFLYWAMTPGHDRPGLREHLPGAIAFTLVGTRSSGSGGPTSRTSSTARPRCTGRSARSSGSLPSCT